MQVEVVRSSRRRKTVALKPTADGVRVLIPARASKAEEQKWVSELVERYQRRQNRPAIDLPVRAAELAKRFDLPIPSSIEWSDTQNTRWGSTSIESRRVRISSAMAGFPQWVIDAVIVHELAHLLVPSHGPAFWAVANRYPLTERARGYLMAKGLGEGDESD